jgi:diadenosine tetraphosphate (Ap4A) HIT family hydrolase
MPQPTLDEFLRGRMRMSHIYQPAMLRVLLERGGRASRREIAAEFLTHDESQLDYYEQIVARMPGRVLRNHGIVVPTATGYALADAYQDQSETARQAAIRLCDEKIAAFKAERGQALWRHRAPGLGRIPGRVRYGTLKRAGFRCELCGTRATERALDVDHILPRKHGGADTAENLQALCWRCNADKGAGDDTDFPKERARLDHREVGCPFCDLDSLDIVAENAVAVAVRDHRPVMADHTLVIPRRHVADYFDLFRSEEAAVQRLLQLAKTDIQSADPVVAGFNVGINSGAAAGQTVFHCHVHLIPRRVGDVSDPRGGIRRFV